MFTVNKLIEITIEAITGHAKLALLLGDACSAELNADHSSSVVMVNIVKNAWPAVSKPAIVVVNEASATPVSL